MHATRAAVDEGILPGGVVALLRAVESLKRVKMTNEDQKHGIEIVRKATTWPARQIAINVGEDGSVVVGKHDTLPTASTPKPANSAIWSPRESSTRSRWFASPCKMGPQLRAY